MSGSTIARFAFGPFHIDFLRRVLERDGKSVPLTPKAFDILGMLIRRAGQIVEKDTILREVWTDTFVEEANLTQNIFLLRKALSEKPNEHRFIVTIPGRGYRFVAEVRPESNPDEHPSREPSVASNGEPSVASVAVLPFKALTPHADHAFLSLGLADAVITRLSRVGRIAVRPTMSVLKYADLTQDPILAGRDLNVDAVLDGTIQQLGDRIRLTMQFIGVRSGATLWAHQLDEPFTNIFSIQDRVSEYLAQALALKLTGDEQRRFMHNETNNIEAYRLYIKGRYFWSRRDKPSIFKSIECLEKAAALDPNFAPVHAGLADTHLILGEYLYRSPNESFPKAEAAALKVLELDGTSAEARTVLAEVRMFYDWDLTAAEREFREALRIKPNYATARHSHGWMLTALGRFDEARAEFEAAHLSDPLSLVVNTGLGIPHYYKGDAAAAIPFYRTALDMDQAFAPAKYYFGLALTESGEYDEAIAQFEKFLADEYVPQGLSALGHARALSNRREEAEGILRELSALSEHRYVSPYNMAIVHAGLKNFDLALDCLEEALLGRAAWMVFLKVEPAFKPMHEHPRFQELLRKVGLA